MSSYLRIGGQWINPIASKRSCSEYFDLISIIVSYSQSMFSYLLLGVKGMGRLES
jgi:hypothetical protein